MNYKIITDEEELKRFIDWLPELEPDEVYSVNLFARNKYCKEIVHINTDKCQMKRFVATKDWLFRKIKQLETEIGNYWQNEIPIPQEALALYITPNPRSQVKAGRNLLKKLADLVTQPYHGYNVSAEALSELQKAVSRKIFFDVDFDFDTHLDKYDVWDTLRKFINPSAVNLLETRGGWHVLIELAKIEETYKKTWYINLTTLLFADVKGDSMLPVPGCYQGGFTPRLITSPEVHDMSLPF